MASPAPASAAMFNLEHRVRIFVFQVLDRRVEYLLLRQKPREE